MTTSSNSEVSELLPCPFCGGEGAYQTDTEEGTASEEWIGCLNCGATTALEVWNRRSTSAGGVEVKALAAGQRAAMESNGCGLTYMGLRHFCDHPHLPDEMRENTCSCKADAKAAIEAYLSSLHPADGEPVLYGPYGWLNGHRGLSEDSWNLESDPLENNEEYFAIPLYAKVDPFAAAVTGAFSIPAADAPLSHKELVDRVKSIVLYTRPSDPVSAEVTEPHLAWMAFDKHGACELFLDEANAAAWAEDGGYTVALGALPSAIDVTDEMVARLRDELASWLGKYPDYEVAYDALTAALGGGQL